MKFVLGIGNPGAKYEKTRHNVGFRVLNGLAGELEAGNACSVWKNERDGRAQVFETPAALLIKPETYVNLSGECASAVLNGRRASASDLLVVCDDVNLAFGKLRLRASGSAGGHHGLESLVASLGTEEFSRLRVGVGGEGMPSDLSGYVLEEFSAAEQGRIGEILGKAAFICKTWIEQGFESAMNRLSQLQSIENRSES